MTGRMTGAIAAVAAVLLVAMLGWNIAQQREISVLREGVRSLEERIVEKRKSELSGLVSGLTEIAQSPPVVRPARTKTKAGGKAKARAEGETRARTAKAAGGSKAKAGARLAKAKAREPSP